MAETALVNLATRQQVMLEKLKAGEVRKLGEFLKQAADAIRKQLMGDNLTELNRARAEQQLLALTNELRAIYGDAGTQITQSVRDVADYSAGYEQRALQSAVVASVDVAAPSGAQVMAAAFARPLASGKAATMLEPFISGWSDNSVARIDSAIRLGFLSGKTNQEIVRQVIGSKANGYRDGIIDVTSRSAETVVRTAIQHVAQVARDEVYKENADIVDQYEWVSTLDSRTSPECQAMDGRMFDVGKGPLPPLHPNCRSSTVPVINNKFIRETLREGATRSSVDGPVDAKLSYYEWLKTQPEAFQDEAIGPQRAQLLRDGGLSAQRFQELQLNKNFEPITLDEMRKLEPVAFERAGL